MRVTGLDGVLGIEKTADLLEMVPQGRREPKEYFDLFSQTSSLDFSSHVLLGESIVTLIDDHDQIRKGPDSKARFAAVTDGENLALAALSFNLLTLGIPCIYYGSEQAFDGEGRGAFADRYIREAMFGGNFGAFRSRGRHFFDESHPLYRELSKILSLRQTIPALRTGRQFHRQISGNGINFGFPGMIAGQPIRSIVAWSRIHQDHEVLCAINTDPNNRVTAWVTVDGSFHQPNDTFVCSYSTDEGQIRTTVRVEARNGRAIHLSIPPAGVVIFQPPTN